MFACLRNNQKLLVGVRTTTKLNYSSDFGSKSFLKLEEALKTELKKRDLDLSQEDSANVKNIKMKNFLDDQLLRNLSMVRGVAGGTQIKISNNANLFNNSMSVSGNQRFTNILSNEYTGKVDNSNLYNPTKQAKKAAINAHNSVAARQSLRQALSKIRNIHETSDKLFQFKLRDRRMRPCKVRRLKNMHIGNKKFDEGISDYMSTAYALLRRGYSNE